MGKIRLSKIVLPLLGSVILAVVCWLNHDRIIWAARQVPFLNKFFRVSTEAQISKYGTAARSRLASKFEAKGLHYPPERTAFLAIKATRELFVFAADRKAPYRYVGTFPILGASGHLGPKLRSGDRQVPEGVYKLTLEPNTPYHLALRLNYPNGADVARARADGRTDPGSDILIHGTNGSVGCIAVGDPASEDLFVLVYDTEDKNVPLIIAPVDFRVTKQADHQATDPSWLPELYNEIQESISGLPIAR